MDAVPVLTTNHALEIVARVGTCDLADPKILPHLINANKSGLAASPGNELLVAPSTVTFVEAVVIWVTATTPSAGCWVVRPVKPTYPLTPFLNEVVLPFVT